MHWTFDQTGQQINWPDKCEEEECTKIVKCLGHSDPESAID